MHDSYKRRYQCVAALFLGAEMKRALLIILLLLIPSAALAAGNTNSLTSLQLDFAARTSPSSFNEYPDGTTHTTVLNDDSTSTYFDTLSCSPEPCTETFAVYDYEDAYQYGDIVGVLVKVKAKITTGGSKNIYIGPSGYTQSLSVSSTDWTTYEYFFPTDPSDSGSWTWDDINNLSIDISMSNATLQVSDAYVYVVRSYAYLRLDGKAGYSSWQSAMSDFTQKLYGNFTLYIMPGTYQETGPPDTVRVDLNGKTFRVKPSDNSLYPISSTGNTGVVFKYVSTSTNPFFKKSGGTTSGDVIIEGISVDASGSSGQGFNIFTLENPSPDRLIIRNCVIRGADLYRSPSYGIYINTPRPSASLMAYNNFIYDMDDGINISRFASSNTRSYIFNNTIASCHDDGISVGGHSNVWLYNNLCYDNATDYDGIANATGYGNLCKDRTCNATSFGNEGSETQSSTLDANADYGTQQLILSGTGSGCSGTSHYDYINDWNNGDCGTCYVSETGSTYKEDCYDLTTMSAVANKHISRIVVGWNYAHDGAASIQSCISDGTNKVCATENNYSESAFTCRYDTDSYYTNPAGNPWSWDDLANLKMCFKIKNGAYIGYGYVYVYYVDDNGNQMQKTVTFTDPESTAENITEYSVPSNSPGVDMGRRPYNDNLVAWYRFEYGALTVDSAGDYDLTAVGSPANSFAAQEGYGAVYFAQNTAYKVLHANLNSSFPGYTANGSDMTVSFYYKPNNTAEAYLVSYFSWYSEEKYWRWWVEKTASGTVRFSIVKTDNSTDSVVSTATLSSGTNYHIAVTYDKDSPYTATMRIWNVDTNTLVENITDTLAAFTDAASESNFYINKTLLKDDEAGTMDDVRIYNIVLSADEIDLLRDLNKDCFNRPRGTTTLDDNGDYDIGAYEYIAPRDFYIASSGASNTNSGLSGSPWSDFSNLDYRVLNPGDAVKLAKGSTWDDTLNVRGVGSGSTSTRSDYVKVTTYDSGNNPIIDHNGTDADCIYVVGYKIALDNIDARESKRYFYGTVENGNATYPGAGIHILCSNQIYLNTVTSKYNGINGSSYQNDGWAQTPGFFINWSSYINLDSCNGSYNDGDGLKAYNSPHVTIANSTFNYNGRVGGYKHGHGITIGVEDEQHSPYATITDTECSYNGFIGIDVGMYNLLDGCSAHYNGGGWSTQQLFICQGTNTDLAVGDSVVQDTTGATGTIYTINDSSYTRAGATNWISIRPDGYNAYCEDVDDPYNCCTGLGTGTCDFNDDNDIKETTDANDKWVPTNGTGVTFKTDPLASGGGIDLTYADESIVRYSMANYNIVHPDKADAYGFCIDNGTDNAIVHHCIAVMNDGAGFETNVCGQSSDCTAADTPYDCCTGDGTGTCAAQFYNNLAYANTQNANHSGGFTIGFNYANEPLGKVIMKNNISVWDKRASLVAMAYTDNDLMTLDNNIYWMGSNDDVIIRWSGKSSGWPGTETDYKASHASDPDFADFKALGGYETNGFAQDPLIYDIASVGFAFRQTSPAIDKGVDISSLLSCTPATSCTTFSNCCKDSYDTLIPIDGDNDATAEWDIGPYEWYQGIEWGKTGRTTGYDFRGWTEYGWAGTGRVKGGTDSQSGSIELDDGEYLYSTVKDTGNTRFKSLTLGLNATGSGIQCWRGSSTKFNATDTSPEWEQYIGKVNKTWRYVQIGLVNGASCSVLP